MKTKQLFAAAGAFRALRAKAFVGAMFATALLFSSAAFAQVKIGTNPTTINAANNLEVEASTAGNKVSVDKTTGKVTIADGSQATGNILTSDANGVATWQSTTNLRIPETVWIGEQVGVYGVTPFTGTFDEVKDRIPMTARTGSLAGYDPTTKRYTLQASGYYRINIGALIQGTTGGALPNFVRLYMGTTGVLQQFDKFNVASGPVLSTFWEGYFTAGTVLDVYVISETNGGTPQVANVSKAFMSITKLF